MSHLGTGCYRAPEILEKKIYNARKVDVFAFGVILYVFAKGNFPFNSANILSDAFYKTLIKKPVKYWEHMDRDNKLSNELRLLI